MSAFKNLLKSDTPSSSAGRVGGQGSHFPSKDSTSYAEAAEPTGSTAPGVEPQAKGPSDVSAAAPSSTEAATTAGPEAGGDQHVDTVSAPKESDTTSSSLPTATHTSATASTTDSAPATTATEPSRTSAPTSNPAASNDMSSTEGTGTSAGTAAIGETTTYSSQPLARGDPTGSVVDRESTEPLTYKKPESGAQSTGAAGVPENAASAAAAAAWHKNESMPGGFPTSGYENPYKASRLDPRVDGGKSDTGAASTSSTGPSHASSGAAAGAGAAGIAALGASKAVESAPSSTPAPSSLTSTADPADRSAVYNEAAGTKVPAEATTTTTSTPITSATAEPTKEEAPVHQSTATSTILGGLAAVATTAGAALGLTSAYDNTQPAPVAEAKEPRDTAQPQESGPPKHYRRESIPTTAYPSGSLNSAPAVAPPVGGTHEAARDSHSHLARNAALGSGVAGGALATHELGKTHEEPSATTGVESSSVPQTSNAGPDILASSVAPTSSSAVPAQELGSSGIPTAAISSQPGPSVHDEVTKPEEESHLGRNAALGGAGAAALGSGAYAMHEHNKDQRTTAGTTTLPDRTRDSAIPPTDAVAAAPGRYADQDASSSSAAPLVGQTATAEKPREEEDHTARNAALGAGAVGAAGGAAYAAHEMHDRDAAQREELQKARDAEMKAAEEHRKEQEKAAAKAQKEHEKEIAKEQKQHEKEEKKHQKELEKEEKKHQKEIEKEEKAHQKEAAAAADAETRRREQALAEEEEERKRREKEAAAAGVVGAGAGAAAYGATKDDKSSEHTEKEKKPNIFKRIFKRRKNKDTGEDEDYSTDEEEGRKSVEAGRTSDSHVPHHHSDTKGRNVLGAAVVGGGTYEELSGGAQKPSYNPLHAGAKDDAVVAPTDNTSSGPTTALASDAQPRDSVTGLPYDPSKDPEAARRLSSVAGTDPVGAGGSVTEPHGRGTDSAPLGGSTTAVGPLAAAAGAAAAHEPSTTTTASHTPADTTTSAVTSGTTPGATASTSTYPPETTASSTKEPTTISDKPIDTVTGLPYDPSKDSAAAERLAHVHDGPTQGGSVSEADTHGRGTDGAPPGSSAGAPPDFKLGEVQEKEHQSLGEKIKEKLHLSKSHENAE